MHDTIIEHIYYERGKAKMNDGEDYFNTGTKRSIGNRGEQSKPQIIKTKSVEALSNVQQQLEELLYLVGDRPEPASEDELMNYIIGMIESVKIKREQITSPWLGYS